MQDAAAIVKNIADAIYLDSMNYDTMTPLYVIAEGMDDIFATHCPDWAGSISERFAQKLANLACHVDDYPWQAEEHMRNLRNAIWALLPESVWPLQSA